MPGPHKPHKHFYVLLEEKWIIWKDQKQFGLQLYISLSSNLQVNHVEEKRSSTFNTNRVRHGSRVFCWGGGSLRNKKNRKLHRQPKSIKKLDYRHTILILMPRNLRKAFIHSMDYTHIPSTTKKFTNHTADPSTW